ncbi:MAG: hypothetical protein JSW28_09410 [Thermoplasmata archaeon]|nr:MAG: hypothetical protein JSW28_09410 [Thermoplasmata archaeon]
MDFKAVKTTLMDIIKKNDLLVILSFFIIALVYTSELLLSSKDLLAYAEIPYFFSDTDLQISAMTHHHQFPYWNNYFAMGFPLYAQPTNNVYYPFVWPFVMLLGPLNGLKAIVVFHVFLSAVGFWFYSEHLTENKYSRYYGSLLYMLSGAFAIRILEMGHITLFVPYAWIPICLFFLNKSIETRKFRYIIACSISIAMLSFIGAYFLFYFSLLFVVYALSKIVKIKRVWRPKLGISWVNLAVLLMIGILAFMLSAIKIVPVYSFNSNAPRQVFGLYGSISANDLLPYFIDKHASYPVSGGGSLGHYAFLGILPMLLVPLSILHKCRFKFYLMISSLVFALWAMGLYTPFGIAHILPIASSIRAPERALLILTFLFVSLSVLGLDWLLENFRNFERHQKFAAYALLLLIMFAVGLELITPLLIWLAAPSNYEGYMLYTQNRFTAHTLVAVLAISVVILLVSIKLLNIEIKRYSLAQVFNSPKTFCMLMAVFCALNLVVVNLPLFSGVDEKEQSNVTPGVIELIPSDHSEPVWINFSEPIAPFRLNQVTLMENDLHLATGLFGSAKAYYRIYKPGANVTIGDKEYYLYDYEFAQYEFNDTDHIYVGQFNMTIENESLDPASEPGSVSEFTSSRFTIVKNYYNATIYVYRMNNSLPNAFILRDESVIPIEVASYSPNRIEVKTGEVREGDKVVFKGSYYPGWKAGRKGGALEDVRAYQRMISYDVDSGGANVTYVFEFFPGDFLVGSAITLLYFPLLAVIFILIKKKKGFTFLSL